MESVFGYFERVATINAIRERLEKVGKKSEIPQEFDRVLSAIAPQPPSATAFLSLGVISFCLLFYLRTLQGIARRVPPQLALADLAKEAGFSLSELTPGDVALLTRLRWQLANLSIPPTDVQSTFKEVIGPAVTNRTFLEQFMVQRRPTNGDPPVPNPTMDGAEFESARHNGLEWVIAHLVNPTDETRQPTATPCSRVIRTPSVQMRPAGPEGTPLEPPSVSIPPLGIPM